LEKTQYAIAFENYKDRLNPTVNFASCDSNSYYFPSGEGLFEIQSFNAAKKYCLAKGEIIPVCFK